MSKSTKILNAVVVVLVILAILADVLFVYYKFFNKDITIGIYNITEQLAVDAKSQSEMTEQEKAQHEARTLFTVNLYSNDNKNGIELQELNINYFSDYNFKKESYRSTGMQYIGDFKSYITNTFSVYNTNQKVLEEFIYYDTTNGISYNGYNGQFGSVSTVLNRNQQLIITIDNEAYAIQLDGKKITKGKFIFWEYNANTLYYDYGDLFATVMQAVKNNSKGYGDGYITLDLSQYFSIKKYDKNSGKFLDDDVTDIIKEYAEIKFHYDKNGAKQANQSLFKCIQNSNTYGLTDDEKNVEYWSENEVIDIDLNQLNLRYSEVHNGYYASLSTAMKSKINDKTKLNIIINLSNKKILGLDYDAFKNVKVESLKIIGAGNFEIKTGALIDTGLKKIIKSADVNIIISDNSINSEYAEVIA